MKKSGNVFRRLLSVLISVAVGLSVLTSATWASSTDALDDAELGSDGVFGEGLVFGAPDIDLASITESGVSASIYLSQPISISASSFNASIPGGSWNIEASVGASLARVDGPVVTQSGYYGQVFVDFIAQTGTTLDYQVPFVISGNAPGVLVVGGSFTIGANYTYRSDGSSQRLRIWDDVGKLAPIFDTAQLLLDGNSVGDIITSSDGTFVFPNYEYSVSSSGISSLGIRFSSSSLSHFSYQVPAPISISTGLNQTVFSSFLDFRDSLSVSFEEVNPIIGLLEQILAAIQSSGSEGASSVVVAVNNASTAISNAVNNTTTTITNIFQSAQEQVAAAKEVTDAIKDKADDIKSASEEIAAGTPKPDAPELAQANNPMEWIQRTDSAYMSGVDSFQQILSDQLFLTMLMLVAGFALCAYVLYGKRA